MTKLPLIFEYEKLNNSFKLNLLFFLMLLDIILRSADQNVYVYSRRTHLYRNRL